MTNQEARVVNILLSQMQLQIDLQILQTELQINSMGIDNHDMTVRAIRVLNELQGRREKILEMGQQPAEATTTTWRHPETGVEGSLR